VAATLRDRCGVPQRANGYEFRYRKGGGLTGAAFDIRSMLRVAYSDLATRRPVDTTSLIEGDGHGLHRETVRDRAG